MGSIQFQISTGLRVYLVLWLSALMLSLALVICKRRSIALVQKSYWLFLFERWKLITFAFATFIIALAAPYSGDHTWDLQNSIIISVATYIFAPWSIAVLYRAMRSRKLNAQFWVALCFLFIPCWTYDLYIVFRDNIYPPTWYNNLYISGGITIIAGLFWNLYYRNGYGITFAFKLEDWPSVEPTPFVKVFGPCFLLGIPVVAGIGWFVYMYVKN